MWRETVNLYVDNLTYRELSGGAEFFTLGVDIEGEDS